MARQVSKVLQVASVRVVPEVTSDVTPEVNRQTVTLNLFDIDPHPEVKKNQHVDLDLDQLEDSEE